MLIKKATIRYIDKSRRIVEEHEYEEDDLLPLKDLIHDFENNEPAFDGTIEVMMTLY